MRVIYLFCQHFQVTAGIHRLVLCEMCCALIYIKCGLNLGRENQTVFNSLGCSVCCFPLFMRNCLFGFFSRLSLMPDSVCGWFMTGIWDIRNYYCINVCVGGERWSMETGVWLGNTLWPLEKVSRESVNSRNNAFREVLLQQKPSAALSSEWINKRVWLLPDVFEATWHMALTLKNSVWNLTPKGTQRRLRERWPSCSVPSSLWKAHHSYSKAGNERAGLKLKQVSCARYGLCVEFITVLCWLHWQKSQDWKCSGRDDERITM